MSSKIDSTRTGEIKVKALLIIVYIVMGLTLLLMCLLPYFAKTDTGFYFSLLTSIERNTVVAYIILCCLPFLCALFIVKKICDLISQGDSFSIATLSMLSGIVTCCYTEAAINVIAIFLFPMLFNFQFNALCFLIIGICGAVTVFTTVLKELVKSAIRLREENELTI